MAILPRSKEERTLKDLKVGESCYTVPWAMWVNKQNVCFLNEGFSVSYTKVGAVQLKVERVEDGYVAYIYDVDHKWTPCDEPVIIGASENDMYGKVVGFGVNSYESLVEGELEDELNKAVSKDDYEKAIEIRDYIQKKYPKK